MNLSLPKYTIHTTVLLVVLLFPFIAFAGLNELLYNFVVGFFGRLAGFGGMILNVAAGEMVIGFGEQYSGAVGNRIDQIWVTMRDFFNISFIFGLVYIGFKMILDSDNSDTRRWLVYLIMAALLVNFSLFITKFVVDVSNVLASEIILGTDAFNPGVDDRGKPTVNISDGFMDRMGITSTFSGDNRTEMLDTLINKDGGLTYVFGIMIVLIIAAFVFAAGGILLIIRFAVLLIYLVLSPFMFIGWVFPQLQKYTSMYWKGFLGRAFFAPIYFLMLAFSIQLLDGYVSDSQKNNGNIDFSKTFAGEGIAVANSALTTLAPFIMASIFLIASIVIANKMGAQGASAALSVGKKMSKGAQRRVGRSLTYAPRKAGGYVARGASNRAGNFANRKLDQWQKSGGVKAKIAGSVLVSDTVGGTASKLKSNKFGLNNTVDENTQKKSAIAERVSNNEAIKSGHTAQDELANEKLTPGTLSTTGDIWDESANGGNGGKVSRVGMSQANLKKLLEQNEARGTRAENKLSQKELEMMLSNDKDTFDRVVGNINATTFDKLMESDNLNPAQKSDALAKRQDAIRNIIEEGGTVLSENLQNMSLKQIETMGDEFVRENAHLFSQSQMDDINKSKVFTESQRGAYITARKDKQKMLAISPADRAQLFNHNKPGTTSVYDKEKKAVEVAHLPFEVFINPATGIARMDNIGEIDASVLEEIYNKKTMTADQRSQLKTAIMAAPTSAKNTSAKNYLASSQGARTWS